MLRISRLLGVGMVAVLACGSAIALPSGASAGQASACGGMPATITAQPGQPVVGTDRRDVIVGTSGDDVIRSGSGRDVICARGGSGRVLAGHGRDDVWGGAGADTIKVGDLADEVFGGRGADLIVGGRDWDHLWGGRGNDVIQGGEQSDRLYGDAGNDRLFGGPDFNVLSGGPGRDHLIGGDWLDWFRLTGDGDTVTGGAPQDKDRVSYRHPSSPAPGPVTVDLAAGVGGVTGDSTVDPSPASPRFAAQPSPTC
jgi:hypothetical protein